MAEIEAPKYLDGEPVNLAAAALDALDWLRFFKKRTEIKLNEENVSRLALAIGCLESFLPKEEPIFIQSEKKESQ